MTTLKTTLLPQTGHLLTKVCRECKLELPLTDYYGHQSTRDHLRHECKKCINKSTLISYLKNKDARVAQRKDYHFRSNYGLTRLEVEELKMKQNFKCMICDDVVDLVVDHCHETGKVRDLLCNKCNQGLGSFKDDPEITDKATNYLRKYL